jgi:hypothetical protein
MPLAKDPNIIFEMPVCRVQLAVSHSSSQDAVSLHTQCTVDLELDSTKISILSQYVLGTRSRSTVSSTVPATNQLHSTPSTPTVDASRTLYDVKVAIESIGVSMFVGDIHHAFSSKIKDLPSQYIQFGCYGVEVALMTHQSMDSTNQHHTVRVDSYRMSVRALGKCDDLWYCPTCSSLAIMLQELSGKSTKSPQLRYFRNNPSSLDIFKYLELPDTLALKVALRCSSFMSGRISHAPSVCSPWPWLCSEKDVGKGPWFEARGRIESIVCHESGRLVISKRPVVAVKLRKSDVIFHLPTISTVASLFINFVGSATSSEMPTGSAKTSKQESVPIPLRLPDISLEVQPIRVSSLITPQQIVFCALQ